MSQSSQDFSDLLGQHSVLKKEAKEKEEKKKQTAVVCKDYILDLRDPLFSENEDISSLQHALKEFCYAKKELNADVYCGLLRKLFEALEAAFDKEQANIYFSLMLQNLLHFNLHTSLKHNVAVVDLLLGQKKLFYITEKNEFVLFVDEKTYSNILHTPCFNEYNHFSLASRYKIFKRLLDFKEIKENPHVLVDILKKCHIYGTSLITTICRTENLKLLKKVINILSLNDVDFIKRALLSADRSGGTPLMYTCMGGNHEMIKYLISLAKKIYGSDTKDFKEFIKQAKDISQETFAKVYNVIHYNHVKSPYSGTGITIFSFKTKNSEEDRAEIEEPMQKTKSRKRKK